MGRKMTDGWDEIFRAGPAVDSRGRAHNFTVQDLDNIIAKYNDGTPHQAAITIGHPTGKAPAYGWVAKLKREGISLFAQYSQVDPAFEEGVKAGRWKKKSVGLRDDYGIDHVAYLGAQPPAIKGLKDYEFQSGEEVACYEFSEADKLTVLFQLAKTLFQDAMEQMGISPAAKVKTHADLCSACTDNVCVTCCPCSAITMDGTAGAIINADACSKCGACVQCCPNMTAPLLALKGAAFNQPSTEENDMKLEDLVKEVQGLTAGITAMQKQMTTFSETMKTQGETITALQGQLTQGEEATARREFEQFCDSLPTRITPAMKPGIVDALMLARKGAPIEFEENGQKKSVSAVDDYKTRLMRLPEVVQFEEHATRERAGSRQEGGLDAQATARKVTEFMEAEQKAGRTVTYAQALVHVERDSKGGAK